MNLTKLKNYAPAARNALINAVTQRAVVLGIRPTRGIYGPYPEAIEPVRESGDVALIGGRPFPRSIVPLRLKLINMIEAEGFQETMEAMAYTWFNRLVALRFMELHDGYLDHGYRVLSHPQGTPLPEILQHAEHVALKGLDREEVIRLKLDGNRDEELYRLLLLAQCAELNLILPDVFSKLDDATILLLPENLLHSDSVIRQLVAGSDAEDWQEVEVLGWLYQFYISEKKDAVMARKSAVPTEDIPTVTQLFTPHWIVRYLVENSLGRLWLLNRPGSRLREHMPYYIEGEADTDFLKISKPEEIKLLDPAVGSGHMLTYAFDLLVLIYEEEGYAANDIPGLILRHNLHGLDLCPRAAQLAELALVFKAREKSRRFFSPGNLVRPNIIELQNVRFAENELREYFQALEVQPSTFSPDLIKLLHQFEEAKNFGSLIQPCLNEAEVQNVRLQIQNSESKIQNSSGQLFLRETHLKVQRVLEQAEALTQRYHVVVANPPYMGGKNMNALLKAFLEKEFEPYKSDLFSAFIVRCLGLSIAKGHLGFMTPFVWMFIASYEDLRRHLLTQACITSLIQLEYSGFAGATVPICTFSLKNTPDPSHIGSYIRLSEFRGPALQEPKTLEAIRNPKCGWMYNISGSEFEKIPGCPISFWASASTRAAFAKFPAIIATTELKQGLTTRDNALFVRLWHEVSVDNTGFGMETPEAANSSNLKWFPYDKGGGFRKWFGNNDCLVNWKNNGVDIHKYSNLPMTFAGAPLRAKQFYFQPGITWGAITSSKFSIRWDDHGFIPSNAGMKIFSPDRSLRLKILGLLNSTVAEKLLSCISETLNFDQGVVARVPLAEIQDKHTHLVEECIGSAKSDWDNFETSWDFRDQPLLRAGLKGSTLESSWRNWEAQSTATIRRMQELESENNRLFITAYGLEGELEPQVPPEQITLARADAKKDMAAFLSYAVGCIMGRYSPDHPGLILANAGDSLREFLEKVGKPLADLTFAPDEDGIIPVLDGDWFEDDVVARAKEFLRATFGEASLNENMRFIEESLGKELRSYFLNDYYKDHLQTYKNRPIYWQFSSGKQKAFQCLVYIHRYTPGTLARIRTEYAIPLQGKLAAHITRLEEDVTQTSSSAARKKIQTELDKCKKQMVELLAFDEQLRSYADQAITLDLDDGVKTNYAKFGPLVAEAKKIYGTKDD